jgi:hypothetical protein
MHQKHGSPMGGYLCVEERVVTSKILLLMEIQTQPRCQLPGDSELFPSFSAGLK